MPIKPTLRFQFFRAVAALVVLLALFGLAPNAAAQADFPEITLEPVTGGLEQPTSITYAPEGGDTIYVTERTGRVRIIRNGTVSGTFLDISDRVGAGAAISERGLLGLAFTQNYPMSGYFFVYYTDLEGDIIVSRFKVSEDRNTADAMSERVILALEHSQYSNHNGGQLAFGPDGYLYIGTGDGGGVGDPLGNGQDLGSLLGKILRIDVGNIPPGSIGLVPRAELVFTTYLPFIGRTVSATQPTGYTIPSGNPFVDTTGALPEIWAYGLRNPWRFSFDRATGDLYIADVGQGTHEEVNIDASGSGGQNYGWNIMEGPACYNASSCDQTGLTFPAFSYAHGANEATGCSVTGGYVYRGDQFPAMQGFYFFGDYCSGRIWAAVNQGGWQVQELLDTGHSISTFGEDEAGKLYLADFGSGEVWFVASNR